MAQNGRLVQWNDERGFGFVEADDGQRLFVHVSAIGRIATRPRVDDRVTFIAGHGPDGRPQARSVRISGANPVSGSALRRGPLKRPKALDWRIPAAVLLVSLVLAGLGLDRIGWPVLLAYGAMGLVSFLAYRSDKTFAEAGHWRISEVTLLGLDLCLGVIGGLLGQALFRPENPRVAGSIPAPATTFLLRFYRLMDGDLRPVKSPFVVVLVDLLKKVKKVKEVES